MNECSRRGIWACRCPECREARNAYHRARYKKRHPNSRPRGPHRSLAVIEDYLELTAQGYDRPTIALRLGYPDRRGLDRAIARAYHTGLLPRPTKENT